MGAARQRRLAVGLPANAPAEDVLVAEAARKAAAGLLRSIPPIPPPPRHRPRPRRLAAELAALLALAATY